MLEINGRNLCEHCFSEIEENTEKCSHCTFDENNSEYPTALPEGTILAGRYVVGRVLGKGGFGITYLCYDTRENKTVAIKEYLPDHLTHRNTGETHVSTYSGETEEYFRTGAQKFFEEAKLVSNFNGNPNIISVYEFFYENNTTYFVMEYLDGVDLKTYIKQKGGKIPEGEALYIADKVVQALMIVHSTNILHRDISPDNIFICSDGKIKLIDFGAARQVMGEVSKSLSVVLKEGFAPYEQYSAKGKQGPWTDIYALGATLYYALTGEKLDNAMDRLTENSQLSLENISPGFAEIITKMVEVKREDRYQDTFELSKAFSALIAIAENEETEKVDETVNDEETVKYEENNKEVKDKVSLSEKIKAFTVGTVQKIKDSTEEINLDAKAKKRILAVVGLIAVVIISVAIAVSVTDKNNVTESSGGSILGDGTPTLNGTVNVDDLTEESKTSATEKEKTKAEKEEKTTKKKTEKTTKKKVTTTKKKTSTTKNTTQKLNIKKQYSTIAAGALHTVAVKSNGTVVAVGNNKNTECDVSDWKNIVSVSAEDWHTVGWKADGTVVATGSNSHGQINVSGWKNIIAVATGDRHTIGLKSDGTVVATGDNEKGQCNVSGWKNIVAVSTSDHTVGLKSNGTVVATGSNSHGQINVSGWKNIVAVSVGDFHSVGLKPDGTVVATGYNGYGQCNVSGWKNIIAVSAGDHHTVGLKSDGTVVAVGFNDYGQCNVSGWKNIIAVSAGDHYTVGLKSDGTVVAVGFNDYGQCDVSGWSKIKHPKFAGVQ